MNVTWIVAFKSTENCSHFSPLTSYLELHVRACGMRKKSSFKLKKSHLINSLKSSAFLTCLRLIIFSSQSLLYQHVDMCLWVKNPFSQHITFILNEHSFLTHHIIHNPSALESPEKKLLTHRCHVYVLYVYCEGFTSALLR
jgi:hypothetical protein